MPTFYVDHDVAADLAVLLTAAGHPATTARDQGLGGARDYVQMLVAWERESVIVTHNQKDFVELYEAWQVWPRRWGIAGPPVHPGVIILQQLPVSQLVAPLTAFLAGGHPLVDTLVRWRLHLGWQRWAIDGAWQPVPFPR